MGASAKTRVVVTDANVLINMIHTGRLDLLGSLGGYEFVVPEDVVAEMSFPEHAAELTKAFEAGHLERLSFAGTKELEIYADLVRVLGKDEAACLAMAQVQGCYIASDEKRRFLRLAEERLGPDRILNTAGIFVLAIRTEIITVEEADEAKQVLEGHRFKMRFSSFRDLILKVKS